MKYETPQEIKLYGQLLADEMVIIMLMQYCEFTIPFERICLEIKRELMKKGENEIQQLAKDSALSRLHDIQNGSFELMRQ